MYEKIKSFTDLIAWKEAHKFVLSVYKQTKTFPEEEKFSLTNQIRRSAVSITSNIAEGFGRGSRKDKQHFYTMSKTSLAELQSQFFIAKDLGYIKPDSFEDLFNESIKVDKFLAGLIKSASDK